MGMLVSWLTFLALVWIGTRIDKLVNVVADRGQPH
jgi:hypothetical protein